MGNCWSSHDRSLSHRKQLNCLVFRELSYQGLWRNSSSMEKTSSNRSNSGRTSKLTDRDRRALKRIVGRKHRIIGAKVTAGFNHLNIPVSNKTIRRELSKAEIMEEPLSGYLRFSLSTFRRGWSGVHIIPWWWRYLPRRQYRSCS